MKEITCVAIDDEPLALLVINRFCERKGNMKLTTFSEPRIGLQEIIRLKPDLVFLDIEMNSISGLEIAHTLPQESCFIFTTAHAQYALEGFNLDAVDFLHKPFSYDRFVQAVEKGLRRIKARHEKTSKHIVIKQEYNNITLPINQILYVKAMENYIRIFRTSGPPVLSRTSMKTMREMLPVNGFIRVHRSYIVSVNKVERFSKREIKLSGCETTVPIGRQYAEKTYETLTAQKAMHISE